MLLGEKLSITDMVETGLENVARETFHLKGRWASLSLAHFMADWARTFPDLSVNTY